MKTPREAAHDKLASVGWWEQCKTPLESNSYHEAVCERLTSAIEQARADGVIEAYAALVGLRTRYSMTEMAEALERACTALGVDLTLVRDRIPPG